MDDSSCSRSRKGGIAWQLHPTHVGSGAHPDPRLIVPCRLDWLTSLGPDRVRVEFDPTPEALRLRHAELIRIATSGAAITQLHLVLPDGAVVEMWLWPLAIESLGIEFIWWQLEVMPWRRDPLPPP